MSTLNTYNVLISTSAYYCSSIYISIYIVTRLLDNCNYSYNHCHRYYIHYYILLIRHINILNVNQSLQCFTSLLSVILRFYNVIIHVILHYFTHCFNIIITYRLLFTLRMFNHLFTRHRSQFSFVYTLYILSLYH